MLLCRPDGIEAAADRFPALPAAALTVQAVVTVDNGGLALTFALVERRISPKAGIIKSLKIPNSTIRNRTAARQVLSQISIYTSNLNTSITTLALVLLLISSSIPTTTSNNFNIHNGSTMSGGSR